MEPSIKNEPKLLSFTPLIDMGFWSTLAKKKLEEYKLDDSSKKIIAKYKINNFKDKLSYINFDLFSFHEESSLNDTSKSGPVEVKHICELYNTNTIEDFKIVDFKAVNEELCGKILAKAEKFFEGADEHAAYNLNSSALHTFADLKGHVYHYKFSAPAVKINNLRTNSYANLKETFDNKVLASLEEFLRSLVWKLPHARISPYLLVEKRESNFFELTPEQYIKLLNENDGSAQLFIIYIDSHNQPEATNNQILNIFAAILKKKEALATLSKGLKLTNVILLKDFLAYNENRCLTFKNSTLWSLDLTEASISYKGDEKNRVEAFGNEYTLEPRSVDLKSHMDEKTLATNAVDLNLKLMKWRLLPELELEKIQGLKVLLFGAGTLGCQLSRNLIGWGVRTVNFIDYGKVAYSNPVRQSLYTFEDSKLGKPKAETAAESLKKIFPDIDSTGYTMQIPMPGHYVSTPEQAKSILDNVALLDDLVSKHDAIFLLTDTRESRWLPTVLANKYNKICISVALGFDSFLIIRHGISPLQHEPEIHGERLGCYFCNDIIAPSNTLADRTLDQQCTVTRPGLSYISSGFASELLISMVHHPLRQGAPADEDSKIKSETCLGYLPQHLRGTLYDYEVRNMTGKAFGNCVACSLFVLEEYIKNRDDFILKVINTPNYLQEVSKIAENLAEIDESAVIELDDDF